jgi:GntP family gluconate:H+ symporter
VIPARFAFPDTQGKLARIVSPADPASLLLVTFAGVALVILLVSWMRMPAFVALAVASLFVGVAARMPLAEIPRSFQQGMGDTLGFISIVIGLGTIIGKLLAESGGALVVSRALVDTLGERRLDWALLFSGFLIGLPVFFQVGLVLLTPVLFTLTRHASREHAGATAMLSSDSVLRLGIPLVAGLSAAHGLVPPHPGPLAAIERLGADTGRTLLYSLIVALPAAMISGPFFGGFISRRVRTAPGGMADQLAAPPASARPPSLGAALLTILLPVLLMLAAALAQATMADGVLRRSVTFAGSPIVAMLVATLLAMYTFGRACGFDTSKVLRFAEESLPPIASVLLVVGAGGGFGRVLDAAGADTAIADAMRGFQLSPLVLGWLIAVLLRIAVGSATVACVTAASIMAPVVAAAPNVNRDLMVVAIGAGSLIASHVNDGGFWLVKEYFNMTVPQTVLTWTILETIVACTGLAGVLLLALLTR